MVDHTNMGVGDGRPKYLQKGKKRGQIGKNVDARSEPSGILGRWKGRGRLVILYCTAYHPILFGSFNMFKILLLALSTSVQDFAILLQS